MLLEAGSNRRRLPDDAGFAIHQPASQLTSSAYDARNDRVAFSDSVTGSTTTYDPSNNYQILAFYLPTGSGKEHQTLYSYDARHRLAGITEQLCTISSGHSCSSTSATGSDSYSYDDNDNRTTVNESNGATSSDQRYCYDALNRLQYRNTGAACSSGAKNESYTYDPAGNRTQTVIAGTTTNFAYNSSGQLCKTSSTSCTSPNVTYDSAGRTASYNGWVYTYDAEGRMTSACKSTSCSGSIDKVEFSYDGDGHRTQLKATTAFGTVTTTDFIYQGDAIVQETNSSGTVTREYIDDDQGKVIKFCDPNCGSPTTTYLVTWNGHGDAIGAWRIKSDGTLELANSYIYSSWGTPTVDGNHPNSANGGANYGDLGLRFLYVGAQDVQWDNFSGLGLYYMHARHYSPALARFLQPDPARADVNAYAYVQDSPVTLGDPTGNMAMAIQRVDTIGGGGIPYKWLACLVLCSVATYAIGHLAKDAGLQYGIQYEIRKIAELIRLHPGSFLKPQSFPTSLGRRYLDLCMYPSVYHWLLNPYHPEHCWEIKSSAAAVDDYYTNRRRDFQYAKDREIEATFRFTISVLAP